ncbi:phosphodiester glycosidase family protein [Brevibacillus daliensis]|uniref:phosphodiester glycosidase family protein n=1 Tax=Brevibacillus daliensis TaxID=2892995 RepID=UPI001E2E2FEA|nr:phosphodiester glycosidase family protein [Brevibacillus daliensis]
MKTKPARFLSLLLATTVACGVIVPVVMPAYVAEAATIGPLTTVWQTPIGEGTTLTHSEKAYGDKKSKIYITKVDLNNPYVEVKPIYGTNGNLTERQTITKMTNEAGAIAGVNSDFFNMSKKGAPFGVVVKDGETISSMGHLPYWYSLGITKDKTAFIEDFGFTGKVTAQSGNTLSLRGVNKEEYLSSAGKSHENQLNLYTPAFGKNSLGTISGYKGVVEVVVQNDIVTAVRENQPGTAIPSNGYVLWGHGTAASFLKTEFPIGSVAQVDYQSIASSKEWEQAMGGHLLLVKDGKALTKFTADGGVTGTNSRTGVGVSQDGKTLYLVSVEMSSSSRGLNIQEFANLMKEVGAYTAANLDGGGSQTLAVRMLGETEATLANRPKEGTERRVPTGIGVFNTAPPGELTGFKLSGPTETLIGQTVQFEAKGYDNHFLPYKVEPNQITWGVQGDTGSFSGNSYTPTHSGTSVITANVNGVESKMNIHVVSGAEVEQVIVTPTPLNVMPNQTLPLDIKIKTKKGQLVKATPLSVNASVNNDLAIVNDQLQLVVGDKEGKATLTVSYDGKTTTVPISIGATEQPWINFDNVTGISFEGNPAGLTSQGSFSLVTNQTDPVYGSRNSAKLAYDFSNSSPSANRFVYAKMGATPQVIPGQPFGLGLWVYGDNSHHWLRAEVIDANGKTLYVDLAKEIDWAGWKQVRGYFPSNAAYPLKLKSIYIANVAENAGLRPDMGTLYFDELSLLMPQGQQFTDIANHPAKKEIDYMTSKGYIKGITPTTFGPENSLTRAQYVTLLSRVFDWEIPTAANLTFKDSVPAYAEGAVQVAVSKGLIKGYDDNTFRPDKVVTRAEAAIILDRLVNQKGSKTVTLKDKNQVPSWASDAVQNVANLGLIDPVQGNFKPNSPTTRATFVVALYRVLHNYPIK